MLGKLELKYKWCWNSILMCYSAKLHEAVIERLQIGSTMDSVPCQRWLIGESETSHWRFISCISVAWFFTTSPPLLGPDAVFSPFILMGEMDVITDYDQFFRSIVSETHTGPIFPRTHIFQTFWHKNSIFRHTDPEKINSVWHLSLSLSPSNTVSRDLGTSASRLALQRTKTDIYWSYRWNHRLKVKTYIKQISCDAKSICFNSLTERYYNTFRQGRGNCLHGRHN